MELLFNQVDKAGATALFEDSSKKANNVGVVVSPTRISSLGEFGTPQFVADKLIQAERRKVCKLCCLCWSLSVDLYL